MLDAIGFPEVTPELYFRDEKQAQEGHSTQEWELPVPFNDIKTPSFPIESLPAPVAAFVEALAISTQTPLEMSAVLSLGVLSTAFQMRYVLSVTPDWTETLNLYLALVALSGERKSSVISASLKPVYGFEAERRESEEQAIARNRSERILLEKALSNAQNNAAKNGAISDDCRTNVKAISDELSAFKEIHPFRLLADDTTPEKLIDLIEKNDGCITVASAEGGVFDSISGRYDKVANFDVYLKGHSGDPIAVDRIGRRSNFIQSPRITMILTIQPEVLSGLMKNTTFRGRGLCGRFLYVICKSKIGHRDSNPEPVPEIVKLEYHRFVKRILSCEDEGIIRLSQEADRFRIAYQESIETQLDGKLEHMRDWGGKLVGAMLRIAALLHAAKHEMPSKELISEDTIIAAVKISDCLIEHAISAYQSMGADESNEDAKYLLKRFISSGKYELKKNDAIQLTRGKFKSTEEMEPALKVLVDMGYIRREQRQTGGRPSEIILINPHSKASKASKAANIAQ